MPRSASRRAMMAPPKPLPITMTSKEVGMPALDRGGSATDAFLVDADGGGRIVAVVAPPRVMELDDVVAVVRADGFGEPQRADPLPVVDVDGRQSPDARAAAGARHEDVEDHRPGRRSVAGIEHVTVDLVAEIEPLAFHPPLALGHLE